MQTIAKIIPLFLIFAFCACKGKNGAVGQNSNTPAKSVKDFTVPQLPAILNTPEEKQEFVAQHYWDNLNFADTTLIHHPEITEQAWADYCAILAKMYPEIARKGIQTVIKKAEADKKVFDYFTDLADKYLYDPNSPMRNEELYIPVLEAILASPVPGEAEKIRPEARLLLAQKNRPDTKALDFTYTLASGATGTLDNIHSDYTLLFFNNPGCHACTETIGEIKSSSLLNRLIEENRLKVMAVYPDEELDEWRRHRAEFPGKWINGYDKGQTIRNQNLYDLKAIPTLYLLDKDKTVLLKDAPAQAIEEYLYQHSGQ